MRFFRLQQCHEAALVRSLTPHLAARMTQKRPIIGIVGGIGSGKSTVAAMLAEHGCIVADSDAAARASLRDPAIRQELIDWWGEGILDEQGEVSRVKVAEIVFQDQAARHRLEALVHPWVEQRRREQFADAPDGAVGFVIDAPLLLEAGLDAMCDALIFVDAPREVRLARVKTARGWDEAELTRREDSQLPLDEKRRRADHTVVNTGDLAQLREQIGRILRDIVETSRT